ncbi:MAG: hypothetical protein AAGK05_19310, partial [Pseudomonadota bacterium]
MPLSDFFLFVVRILKNMHKKADTRRTTDKYKVRGNTNHNCVEFSESIFERNIWDMLLFVHVLQNSNHKEEKIT